MRLTLSSYSVEESSFEAYPFHSVRHSHRSSKKEKSDSKDKDKEKDKDKDKASLSDQLERAVSQSFKAIKKDKDLHKLEKDSHRQKGSPKGKEVKLSPKLDTPVTVSPPVEEESSDSLTTSSSKGNLTKSAKGGPPSPTTARMESSPVNTPKY